MGGWEGIWKLERSLQAWVPERGSSEVIMVAQSWFSEGAWWVQGVSKSPGMGETQRRPGTPSLSWSGAATAAPYSLETTLPPL